MLMMVLLAAATPSALACTIDQDGRQAAMTVRLDEPRGVVRYALPSAATGVMVRALFTREQVMFDGFTLDRASLAIMREGDAVTAGLGAQPRAMRGRCRARGAAATSVTATKTKTYSARRAR